MKLSRMLIIYILAVISNIKTIQSSCVKANNKITCTSIMGLSNMTLGAIEGIGSVTNIEVTNNTPLILSSTAFDTTNSLENVRLQYNQIEKIFPDTFKDLPSLKFVYLNFNSIKAIFAGAFVNLTKLERISLTGNNLKTVLKGVFNNLTIRELTLSRNSISSVEDMALENMPNLTKLKLDGNKLTTIFVHKILTYPEQLEILWLHNNSLTTVSNYMLQKLTNLKLINLGFNSIFLIEPNSFEQTPTLQTLVLTNNQLKKVDGDIFPRTGLNYLEKLYLDNNRLMFLSSNFFFRLNALKAITLVGNPWSCACLDGIWRLLAENNIVEKCAEDYTSGKRPVCVSESFADKTCRNSYNEQLGEKYVTYKKENPLYRQAISCIL